MDSQQILKLLDANERIVYEVIRKETARNGGVFQVSLKEYPELKHLEPQQIARIVSRLVKKGLVRRKLVSNNGRSMYFLQAVVLTEARPSTPRNIRINIPIDISSFLEIPCFTCKELENCAEGHNVNPFKCPLLTNFISMYSKKFRFSSLY